MRLGFIGPCRGELDTLRALAELLLFELRVDRVVYLGPKAQAVLKPLLPADPQEYVFSPDAPRPSGAPGDGPTGCRHSPRARLSASRPVGQNPLSGRTTRWAATGRRSAAGASGPASRCGCRTNCGTAG